MIGVSFPTSPSKERAVSRMMDEGVTTTTASAPASACSVEAVATMRGLSSASVR